MTIVPESAVGPEIRDPGIAVARFADPVPGRTIGLVLRTATAGAEAYAEFGRVVTEVAADQFDATPV